MEVVLATVYKQKMGRVGLWVISACIEQGIHVHQSLIDTNHEARRQVQPSLTCTVGGPYYGVFPIIVECCTVHGTS